MGWESKGSLGGLARRAKEAVDPALRQIADDGGTLMTQRVRENTPVGKNMKPLKGQRRSPPGTLKESIQQKQVVKIQDSHGKGWESGAYTDVIYGPYVEEGTGLWGPRHAKYRIEPKDPNGVLAFFARARSPEGKPHLDSNYDVVEGQLVFTKYVMHPGSPGQHMFAIGAAAAEAEFERVAAQGLQEWEKRSER